MQLIKKLFFNKYAFVMILALLIVGSFGFFFKDSASDFFLKIYRGIDVYTRAYKEIAINYVDTLDPEALMRAGLEGMFKTLDPYTMYIGEKESDELDLVTSGKYGGIGVTIGIRDGYVTIINLIEGFSASKQGIEIGDRIIEVDGKVTQGSSLETIRQMVRGTPGTEVKLKIEREGIAKPLEFVLIREQIQVKNVTYFGYVKDGIGYIKLERFSRTAGEDLRLAIKELHMRGELKGMILDLRDNPGGLLESAVEIISKFVPEKSLVVSTRGRRSDSEKKYYSTGTPMLKDLPMAILVNRYSASASEIVSGAIQDLDRGIIVGSKTFGKGLVQTLTRLSDNATLKMTTARYYTPSGRCIQEIDYWHRDKDGKVRSKPDSLKQKFLTVHKRSVWGGSGIFPDTVVEDTMRYAFLDELHRKAMFFKYANHYASKNKTIPDNFEVTNEIIGDFTDYLKKKNFEYQDEVKNKLRDVRNYALNARYDKSFIEEIDKIIKTLNSDITKLVENFKEEIRTALKIEIIGRIKGDSARIESTFSSDVQLQTALNILKNEKLYNKLLSEKPK